MVPHFGRAHQSARKISNFYLEKRCLRITSLRQANGGHSVKFVDLRLLRDSISILPYTDSHSEH